MQMSFIENGGIIVCGKKWHNPWRWVRSLFYSSNPSSFCTSFIVFQQQLRDWSPPSSLHSFFVYVHENLGSTCQNPSGKLWVYAQNLTTSLGLLTSNENIVPATAVSWSRALNLIGCFQKDGNPAKRDQNQHHTYAILVLSLTNLAKIARPGCPHSHSNSSRRIESRPAESAFYLFMSLI